MRTPLSRRGLIRLGSVGTLSLATVGLLAGNATMARAATSEAAASNDVGILNTALGLEHEAIAAYQIGAESGLLSEGVLKVAVGFQGHHKEHRDALIAAIEKIGGKPVAEKKMKAYKKELDVKSLKSEGDVLNLAARLERGAANAYIGVIPSFEDKSFAQVCAKLAADETMHWTVLAQATGQALPEKAFSFGG